jgi:anti-sigma factor RsiW
MQHPLPLTLIHPSAACASSVPKPPLNLKPVVAPPPKNQKPKAPEHRKRRPAPLPILISRRRSPFAGIVKRNGLRVRAALACVAAAARAGGMESGGFLGATDDGDG